RARHHGDGRPRSEPQLNRLLGAEAETGVTQPTFHWHGDPPRQRRRATHDQRAGALAPVRSDGGRDERRDEQRATCRDHHRHHAESPSRAATPARRGGRDGARHDQPAPSVSCTSRGRTSTPRRVVTNSATLRMHRAPPPARATWITASTAAAICARTAWAGRPTPANNTRV